MISWPRGLRVLRMVAMIRKPRAARMVSPLLGMSSSPRSMSGRRVLMTSFGALSRSSMKIHLPSRTAVVSTPARHANVPGLAPVVYMPINSLASLCSFRWRVTILSSLLSCHAKWRVRSVLPEPASPVSRIGLDSRSP